MNEKIHLFWLQIVIIYSSKPIRNNILKVLEEKLMFLIQIHDRKEGYFQFVPIHQPHKIGFILLLFLKEEGLNFHLKRIPFQNSKNSNLCESSKCIENYIASYGE